MRKRNVIRSEYWERWVEKMRGRDEIGIEQIEFFDIFSYLTCTCSDLLFFLIFRSSDKRNISERNRI